MLRSDQAECRAHLLRETPLAIEVQRIGGAFTWWFPRSQIGYMRKEPSGVEGKTLVVFTAPEWLVEKSQAWDLVP